MGSTTTIGPRGRCGELRGRGQTCSNGKYSARRWGCSVDIDTQPKMITSAPPVPTENVDAAARQIPPPASLLPLSPPSSSSSSAPAPESLPRCRTDRALRPAGTPPHPPTAATDRRGRSAVDGESADLRNRARGLRRFRFSSSSFFAPRASRDLPGNRYMLDGARLPAHPRRRPRWKWHARNDARHRAGSCARYFRGPRRAASRSNFWSTSTCRILGICLTDQRNAPATPTSWHTRSCWNPLARLPNRNLSRTHHRPNKEPHAVALGLSANSRAARQGRSVNAAQAQPDRRESCKGAVGGRRQNEVPTRTVI